MSERESAFKRYFLAPYRFIRADKWLTEPVRKAYSKSKDKTYKYLYGSFYNSKGVTFSKNSDPLKLHADYFVYYFYNKTGRLPGMFQYETVFPLEGKDSTIYKQFKNTVAKLHARELSGWPVIDKYGENLINNFKVDGAIPKVERKLMDVAVYRANTPREAPRSKVLDKIAHGVKDAAGVFGVDAVKKVVSSAVGGGVPGAIAAKVAGNIVQQNLVKANIENEKRYNRPHVKQIDINDYADNIKEKHVISLWRGFTDKNSFEDLTSKIVDNAVPTEDRVVKAASQPPAAARPMAAAGSFIGGGRSFSNYGYKRRYYNRRNYYNNYRRRRPNRRFYFSNFKKNRYNGRKYRKYFRRN